MYKPLAFFGVLGTIPFAIGLALGIRYIVIMIVNKSGQGHVQSLILSSILLLMGFMTYVIGVLADLIAKNRKLLEDVEYHVRRIDYEMGKTEKNENVDKKDC